MVALGGAGVLKKTVDVVGTVRKAADLGGGTEGCTNCIPLAVEGRFCVDCSGDKPAGADTPVGDT